GFSTWRAGLSSHRSPSTSEGPAMTRPGRRVLLALPVLLACLVPARPQAVSDYRGLEPGVDYKHESKAEGPYSIHVLRIDRGRQDWQWPAPPGELRVFGMSPLTRIVQGTEERHRSRAVAAINGDWFEIRPGPYQGDPRGLHIIEGELVSTPAPDYNAFWVDGEGQPHMGVVQS